MKGRSRGARGEQGGPRNSVHRNAPVVEASAMRALLQSKGREGDDAEEAGSGRGRE